MILVLFNWLFILCTLSMLGLVIVASLGRKLPETRATLTIDQAVMVGLVALTTLCNIISLWSPMNIKINIIISGLIIIGLSVYRKEALLIIKKWQYEYRQQHLLSKAAFLLIIFIAIIKTAGPSLVDDEGGYHLPLIRWIEHFPVVPGIANIEDRMGFNPSIYMTNAYFSMGWLFPGGLYDVNSFLFIIFGYSFISGFNRFMKNDFQYLLSGLVQVGTLVFLFRAYLTTMDADFIYLYGSIYLLIIFMQKMETDTLAKPDFAVFVFMSLFTFIITNKFIIGLLAPLPLWLLFLWFKETRFVFSGSIILICLAILIPWTLRNYYISGYLVYPLFFIDLFSAEWKVPRSLAMGQYYYVLEYAKMEITQPFNEYFNHNYTWKVWFPLWFERVWGLAIGKIIILLTPLSTLLILYHCLSIRKEGRQRSYVILLLFLLMATLVWLLRAPAIRFAWGWLLPMYVISLGLLLQKWLLKYQILLKMALIVLLFTSLIRSSIASVVEFPDITKHWLYPTPVEIGNMHTTISWNENELKISEDNFCRGIQPPCLPRYYHPGLRPRGKKITDGFKIITSNE